MEDMVAISQYLPHRPNQFPYLWMISKTSMRREEGLGGSLKILRNVAWGTIDNCDETLMISVWIYFFNLFVYLSRSFFGNIQTAFEGHPTTKIQKYGKP